MAIDSLGDMVLALRSDGQLLRIQEGRAEPILPGRPAVSFRVSAKQRLYAVSVDGLVVQYDGQKWRSLQGLANAWQATLDERSLFFVMNRDGQVFRRVGGEWTMVDNGSGSRQIEASAGRLFVLKQNGNVWRSDDMLRSANWEQLDRGTGTAQIALDDEDAFVLKEDGKLWKFTGADGKWNPVEVPARLVAIRVHQGTALGLSDRSQVLTVSGDRRSATRRALFEQMGEASQP